MHARRDGTSYASIPRSRLPRLAEESPSSSPVLTGLAKLVVPVTILVVFVVVAVAASKFQNHALRNAITEQGSPPAALKDQREVDKLTAEVEKIRSDTEGSLYWLKLAALFVTVGGAMSG